MRRAIKVLAVILSGFVINGLVMAIVNYLPLSQWGLSHQRERFAIADTGEGRWYVVGVYETLGETWAGIDWSHDVLVGEEAKTFLHNPPAWISPLPSVLSRKADWGNQCIVWAQGWPWRCATMRANPDLGAGKRWSLDSVTLSFGRGLGVEWWRRPMTIPYRPYWPGLLANTLFYGVILWLFWFTPGAIKRTLRRRRGLCPKCAYPVGPSELCTECGTARPRVPLLRGVPHSGQASEELPRRS